ncbi:MAG: hypothetical protein O3A53_10105 [Acidobacteria bacterium]|nr:hypothetical protein [Acidobacteriota bacterium]MDA1235142.1 hypothetical protein [Acidobacteriota bacterium]
MRLRTAILSALLLTQGLPAADLFGIWMGQVPGRRGATDDISFQFAQEGDNLSGKLYEDFGSTPLVEGGIEGDQLFFVVVAREQAGNQINLVTYRYEGKVVDGELELTRERIKAVDAVSGTEYVLNERPDDEKTEPPKIRLKRLL